MQKEENYSKIFLVFRVSKSTLFDTLPNPFYADISAFPCLLFQKTTILHRTFPHRIIYYFWIYLLRVTDAAKILRIIFDTYKLTRQDEVSKTYAFPKSHVRYRKPRAVKVSEMVAKVKERKDRERKKFNGIFIVNRSVFLYN